jgi:hypothetical protein
MTLTPVESTLEITTVAGCRVNCQVCPQHVFLNAYKGPRQLEWSVFTTCLDKVPEWVQIDFSGFAEPYLHPRCADMVEYASKHHDVVVYTTMVGMRLEDADRLMKVRPKFVGVHIRDIKDMSPIEDLDPKLFEIVQANEYITHAPAHPDVLQHIRAGARVTQCVLNSHASENWEVRHRTGPLRCVSTRLFRHNVLIPDGRVVWCCMDYGLQHVLGNLTTDSYEALFGEEYQRLEASALDQDSELICRRCELSRSIR